MRNLKMACQLAISVGCAAANAQESASSAPSKDLSAGAYYSQGDYGQGSDTSIYYFPLSFERSLGSWKLQASTAHVEISGAGNVLVNVGGVGRNELEQALSTRSQRHAGIGDTVLSATYQVPSFSASAPFFDLSVELKLPTADETKGLGSGAYDYGVQLDAYQQVGQATLFATLGYKIRERSEIFSTMADSAFLSLGLMRPLNATWSYGVIYDFREAASTQSSETHELLPFLSVGLANNWTLMTYAVKGFTQDSADIAVGAQLNYRW